MFLLFANARGAGTLLTIKCLDPRDSSCIKCPGFTRGMLAVGIDSHINDIHSNGMTDLTIISLKMTSSPVIDRSVANN